MDTREYPKVILTHPLPEDWITELREACELVVGPEGGTGLTPELRQQLPEARGLLCLLDDPIDAAVLGEAESLQVVTNMAVGYDNIDVETCTELGIPVGHTPGVLTEGTADLTMALLLAAARKLPQASRDAREGRWDTWNPTGWLGADLKDAVIGIIGMGKIGSAVARRAAAFETRLLFHNRSPRPVLAEELNAEQVSLDRLLRESDFICLHVPLTDQTRWMIDGEALAAMKETAVLVNAARGGVVHTTALVSALRKGQIRAAALDVTDPEPLPPEHPLYDLDNCLITPHIGSATHHTRETMAALAVENILAGLRGEKLPHCVNPEVYQV